MRDLYSGLARSVQGHKASQHPSLPPQLPGRGLQAGQGGRGAGKGNPGGGRENAELNRTCTKNLCECPTFFTQCIVTVLGWSPAGGLGMVHRLAGRSRGEDQRGSWREILQKHVCNILGCTIYLLGRISIENHFII